MKRFHVGTSLHARADDQQRPVRAVRELLRRQQRHGGRAACGHGGAVQNRDAAAGPHVEHHDIALDAGQAAGSVVRNEGDELGDGNPRIGRRHDKQAAASTQG